MLGFDVTFCKTRKRRFYVVGNIAVGYSKSAQDRSRRKVLEVHTSPICTAARNQNRQAGSDNRPTSRSASKDQQVWLYIKATECLRVIRAPLETGAPAVLCSNRDHNQVSANNTSTDDCFKTLCTEARCCWIFISDGQMEKFPSCYWF